MAGDFARAFQQDMMEEMFGSSSTNQVPSTYWFHLYNTTLNDAATPATTGRVGTTAAADNYTPKNLGNTTVNFSAPTAADPSVSQTKVEIVFTTSATTGWGLVKAVQVASSSGTGGRAIAWADLTVQQTISAGNTVKFSTGAFTVSLT